MAGVWGSSQTRVWVEVPAWLLGEGVEASRGWKLSHHSSGRPRRVQRYLQRAWSDHVLPAWRTRVEGDRL